MPESNKPGRRDDAAARFDLHPPLAYRKDMARRFRQEREYASEQVYREAGTR
jgi:hypothetical protein